MGDVNNQPASVINSVSSQPEQTQATVTPDVTPKVISDGWLKGVDEEYAKEPSLQAIKDLPSLVKSYVHSQRMLGKDKVIIPDSKTATEQDWKNFYSKLGLPSEVNEYKVDIDLEKSPFDPTFVDEYRSLAHKLNILPSQAKGILEYFQNALEGQNKEAEEEGKLSVQSALEGLQKEWGEGFNKNILNAQQVVKVFGDEDMMDYLNSSGIGNDPRIIKFLAKIGSSLKEDTFSSDAVGHLGMTKEEAQRSIDAVYGDLNHPYHNSDHPSHKHAIAEMGKYFKVLSN